jgi:hypothetical protein
MELALKRRLPTFSGGPLGGILPIGSFDELTVPADRPLEVAGAPFTRKNGQGVGIGRVVIVHAGLLA